MQRVPQELDGLLFKKSQNTNDTSILNDPIRANSKNSFQTFFLRTTKSNEES